MRRSGVNGTAKVYFVEEKAACHATMGPHGGDVGVPRGPRDHGDCGPLRGRRGRACVYGETGGEGRWRGEGGNAAAAAAAAVAASAPLRVTLEGAHWRTLAQTTGAPVHLNLSQLK